MWDKSFLDLLSLRYFTELSMSMKSLQWATTKDLIAGMRVYLTWHPTLLHRYLPEPIMPFPLFV